MCTEECKAGLFAELVARQRTAGRAEAEELDRTGGNQAMQAIRKV